MTVILPLVVLIAWPALFALGWWLAGAWHRHQFGCPCPYCNTLLSDEQMRKATERYKR